MDLYNITIYKKAQSDLEEIVIYLNQFSSDTALLYYDEIVEAISMLETAPERCPLVRDEVLKAKGYRWLGVKNYIVFYVIKGKTVQVRRIQFNKRQYKHIL